MYTMRQTDAPRDAVTCGTLATCNRANIKLLQWWANANRSQATNLATSTRGKLVRGAGGQFKHRWGNRVLCILPAENKTLPMLGIGMPGPQFENRPGDAQSETSYKHDDAIVTEARAISDVTPHTFCVRPQTIWRAGGRLGNKAPRRLQA